MIKVNVTARNDYDFEGNIEGTADQQFMCRIVKWLCESDKYEYSSSGVITIEVNDSYSKLKTPNNSDKHITHVDVNSKDDLVEILDDNIEMSRQLSNGEVDGSKPLVSKKTEYYVEDYYSDSMTYKIREVKQRETNKLVGDIDDYDIDFDNLDYIDLQIIKENSETETKELENIKEYGKFEAENKFC